MEKFDKDLEEIKTGLNNIKLSDDFKNNLKIKMEEEFNKSDIKENARSLIFPRKLVATFACFFLLITSCAVFADEIESFVANIFSNTDRKIEEAIANGNYKEIDMEYVEHDGIGIKVDYIVQEEDSLCIAFNVKSEEEFDEVYFDRIEILDKNNQIFFKTKDKNNKEKTNFYVYNQKTAAKEYSIIYEFVAKDINFKKMYIVIENLILFDNDKINMINAIWELNDII
ncbi:MAG: DUF4179 domain-containing protein [Clostridia bacterium]|nr:DUF4179 domain-containing protein [Clostridia bacterium]